VLVARGAQPRTHTSARFTRRRCARLEPALAELSVHPLSRAAAVVAGLSAVTFVWGTRRPIEPPFAPSARPSAAPVTLTDMPCGPRELPEGDACVPLPSALGDGVSREDGPDRALRDAGIPRKPDRPVDPTRLVWPVEGEISLLRGLDGAPSEHAMSVELAAARGTSVRAVGLDAQVGPAEVVAIGRWVGNTVVTRHTVRSDRPRVVLVVVGHLDAIAPDLTQGVTVKPSDLLGFAGDSGAPGTVSVFVQTRLVREDAAELEPPDPAEPTAALADWLSAARSTPTDPRNVLALQP
jgi:hypothetical protein